MSYNPNSYRLLGMLRQADLNSTSDQSFNIMEAAKYIPLFICAANATVNLSGSSAAGGIYTVGSKGGSAIVAAAQSYTGLTSSTVYVALTNALPTRAFTEQTLYFSLTTAHGSSAYADIYVYGIPIYPTPVIP